MVPTKFAMDIWRAFKIWTSNPTIPKLCFFRSDLIETLHDELSNASDGLSTKRSWIQRPLQTNKSFFDALQVISYYDRKYLNNVQIYV